ncbi:MAG: nucleotidyltransferase domain-containing protein [Actinomycetota bacterium]|nr:nucleotidyltransferase domain-containing protein [Actinomycetota bacterium]
MARGDFNEASDIDVLVMGDQLPGRPLDRPLLISHRSPGVEVVCEAAPSGPRRSTVAAPSPPKRWSWGCGS